MASIIARRCLRLVQPTALGKLHLRAPSMMAVQPLSSFGSRVCLRSLSVAIGDTVPNVSLDQGFPPEKVSLADYCKGKKVVLMGLPGAFTPT